MQTPASAFNLESILSELLLEYDCVIIPDFGGFVGNYHPAQINEEKNQIIPPGKSILFNPLLSKNDGLLAQEIMIALNISYQEALEVIQKEVDRWSLRLQNAQKVVISEIGVLTQSNNKISFQQDLKQNLLEEAFGFVVVNAKRVKKDGIKGRLKEEIEYRQHSPSYRANIKRGIYSGIAAILVLGVILWSVNNLNPIQEKSIELKSTFSQWFNSFEQEKEIITNEQEDDYVIEAEVKVEQNPSTENPSIETEQSTEVIENSIINQVNAAPEMDELKESISALEQESTGTIKPTKESQETGNELNKEVKNNNIHHYKIVAGCFQSLENAQAFVKELQNEGYSAQLSGFSKSGLNRVIYSSHSSKIEAMKQLAKVRLNHNVNAWMTSN